MPAFRDLSIKWKQTSIIMMTSTAALLLACVVFVAYGLSTFRDALVREVSTLAGVIGENSKAALIFDDQAAAEKTLAALSKPVRQSQLMDALASVWGARTQRRPTVLTPRHWQRPRTRSRVW